MLKKWPKGPYTKWPMAKGPLDHVVLLGNFMTIITDDNQIFVYLQ